MNNHGRVKFGNPLSFFISVQLNADSNSRKSETAGAGEITSGVNELINTRDYTGARGSTFKSLGNANSLVNEFLFAAASRICDFQRDRR